MSIVNPQSSAYIYVSNGYMVGFELVLQVVYTVAKGNVITHVEDL